jgi:hypothetical protein
MRTRRVVSATVLALALAFTAACNAKQTAIDCLLTLSSGAIAANQQIGANGQPLLSTADTGAIVTYVNQALVAINASANGWQAAVQSAWASAMVDVTKNHPNIPLQLTVALAAATAAIATL